MTPELAGLLMFDGLKLLTFRFKDVTVVNDYTALVDGGGINC